MVATSRNFTSWNDYIYHIITIAGSMVPICLTTRYSSAITCTTNDPGTLIRCATIPQLMAPYIHDRHDLSTDTRRTRIGIAHTAGEQEIHTQTHTPLHTPEKKSIARKCEREARGGEGREKGVSVPVLIDH